MNIVYCIYVLPKFLALYMECLGLKKVNIVEVFNWLNETKLKWGGGCWISILRGSLCVNVFHDMCKRMYFFEGYYVKVFWFLPPYYYLQISTYLNNPKINLNFMFALNFDTIYLFEFLILVEGMKSDILWEITSTETTLPCN